MKRDSVRIKWYVFSVLLFILVILCFSRKFYAAGSEKTLFDDIVEKTSSNIVEYGITTSFKISEDGNKVCDDILTNLSLEKETKVTKYSSDNIYRLDFQNRTTSGYVESVLDEGNDIIKIHIIKSESINNLTKLKTMAKGAVSNYCRNPKFFLYLKAKAPDIDMEHTNRTIVSLLKKSGTIDMDTVNLGKSISTVCYSGKFEPTLVDGKLVDFNFAVCSYTSGKYIIMGTPEILETY